jgi:hypothetical protein
MASLSVDGDTDAISYCCKLKDKCAGCPVRAKSDARVSAIASLPFNRQLDVSGQFEVSQTCREANPIRTHADTPAGLLSRRARLPQKCFEVERQGVETRA